uniref:Uncharacterized protein n=1 Tax=Arundo donax TaxID=35708 RepID=A0A0A9GUQ6_ARUDO
MMQSVLASKLLDGMRVRHIPLSHQARVNEKRFGNDA